MVYTETWGMYFLSSLVLMFTYIISPPRGQLSHLTMYRLGTILFIPAYLTVVLYRVPFGYPYDRKKWVLMTGETWTNYLLSTSMMMFKNIVLALSTYVPCAHFLCERFE